MAQADDHTDGRQDRNGSAGKKADQHAESLPRLRLRLHFEHLVEVPGGGKAMLGPGKVELLEKIDETGSISAAGRSMGMSYKRAWMLVETMNAMFAEPLVESSRGGAEGGGAALTEAGRKVAELYRMLESKTQISGDGEIAALGEMLRKG